MFELSSNMRQCYFKANLINRRKNNTSNPLVRKSNTPNEFENVASFKACRQFLKHNHNSIGFRLDYIL